jgi:hypothetical protein
MRYYWAIVAAFAAVMIAGAYSMTLPCEMDRFRRCDLEPPNSMPTSCGLGHERLC